MRARNISRHPLLEDQKKILMEWGIDEVGDPENIFFENSQQFFDTINDQICCVVAPMDLLLDALNMGVSTTLIVWKADQNARQRKNFACRGAKKYIIENGKVVHVDEINITPTQEINFYTGEISEYQG